MWALQHQYEMAEFVKKLHVLKPKMLTITIRYTDWYYWEYNRPLLINNTWMGSHQFPDSLDTIVMEFETRLGKKAELEYIVTNQALHWRFAVKQNLEDEPMVFVQQGNPITSQWVGAAEIDSTKYLHHKQQGDEERGLEEDEMMYYVVKIPYKKKVVEDTPETDTPHWKPRGAREQHRVPAQLH
jgi:hypothetical protein